MTHALKVGPDSCGCDGQAQSGVLVPLDVALARGLALATVVSGTETLALEDAIGRVLAAPATAQAPMPPFDNAAMDGYALRRRDLTGRGPWTLPVCGGIAAGDGPRAIGGPRALRILTGAPVPPDADAVVMQERVQRSAECITLDRRPDQGENVRRAGEDLSAGDVILGPGRAIGAREIAALAGAGLGEARVHRRLRVAIFSTGSELREPGTTLGPGEIWNSNRPMLRAALALPWIEVNDLGAVPDRPEALFETLETAAAGSDLVISTGGVSVGDADHMPRLVERAGGRLHAMRIAMKPGKPVAVGQLGAAVYVGLPGNPVSAFVTWQLIGARIARARAGFAGTAPPTHSVTADFDLDRRPGRTEFRPARLTGCGTDGRGSVALFSPSFSARIAELAAADGLAVLPAGASRIGRGDTLEFLPLSSI